MKRTRVAVSLLVYVFVCLLLVACGTPDSKGVTTSPLGARVPSVIGLSQGDAASALTAAGLSLGDVTSAFDASMTVGGVSAQTPVAGTEVAQGSPVAIVLSKGPETVSVAEVVRMSESQARSALSALGLQVKTVKKDDGSAKGTVLEQAPAAGKVVKRGAIVTLTVSTGLVRVPSWKDFESAYNGNDWNKVLESTKSAVVAGFKRAGLVAIVEFVNALGGDKEYQSPKAGSRVPKGTKVTIHIPVVD